MRIMFEHVERRDRHRGVRGPGECSRQRCRRRASDPGEPPLLTLLVITNPRPRRYAVLVHAGLKGPACTSTAYMTASLQLGARGLSAARPVCAESKLGARAENGAAERPMKLKLHCMRKRRILKLSMSLSLACP